MMEKKFRFATIGTGKIVRKFLEAAGQCPQLVYEAVYSRTQETADRFAREYQVSKRYTSLEALALDDEIDCVYIASPNCCHYSQAILMMKHKKHVLCEKPVASNRRELEEMIQTARENDVVFLEAMRSVFSPGFDAIAEFLPKLGTIRRATFQYCQYSSRYDNFKNGIIENAFRPELSNGALMDIGVYCVHALVKLFGMPGRIQAQGVFLENGVDGAGTILASYPGMQAELLYSKITDSSLPSQIQGEEASMIIREISDPTELELHYRNGKTEKYSIETAPNNMIYEILEWVQQMELQTVPRADSSRVQNQKQSSETHLHCSVLEMRVLDETRAQLGIVFPHD